MPIWSMRLPIRSVPAWNRACLERADRLQLSQEPLIQKTSLETANTWSDERLTGKWKDRHAYTFIYTYIHRDFTNYSWIIVNMSSEVAGDLCIYILVCNWKYILYCDLDEAEYQPGSDWKTTMWHRQVGRYIKTVKSTFISETICSQYQILRASHWFMMLSNKMYFFFFMDNE